MNPKKRTEWLIKNTEEIYQKAEQWKDKEIKASISLTDRDFDRHGTSNTSFLFMLKSFSLRISGARMMFWGTKDELIEIATDFLVEITLEESKITFLEDLGNKWYKKVILEKQE
ncbi:hypothetical protein [Bernardetia sp.]|uniref:hypothetical protein n=1 Tax=Bernardetia sp. TaxID=1937974 RepID=UPI0025C44E20|nr:hypothetical protein [Bernardetia sp.]